MRRRVVVTGMGYVGPLGLDVATYWQGLLAGRSGVEWITEFPTDKLRSDVAAFARGFDPSRHLSTKEQDVHGRVTQLSLAAAAEALEEAGLAALGDRESGRPPPVARERIGCLLSTGMGSVDIFEEQIERSARRGPRAVSPFFIPAVMPNAGAALLCTRYGLLGPSFNLASACATATHSLAVSTLLIESGEAEVVVAGGAEAATRMNTVAGFGNARALARARDGDPARASRPFDRSRDGFVMAEGAGALILEEEEHARARGAVALARVAGFGMSTDAEHVTRPHPRGLGLRLAIEAALRRAGVGPEAIGYINPHATSTPQGDLAEYLALRDVFGERLPHVPISATKSMVGHLLGGAGAAEAIAVICSLRDQIVHPSINVDELDPALELDVVREARRVDLSFALSCSAGFGGHNAVLVLSRS